MTKKTNQTYQQINQLPKIQQNDFLNSVDEKNKKFEEVFGSDSIVLKLRLKHQKKMLENPNYRDEFDYGVYIEDSKDDDDF